jgi:hypothetical protein
MRNTKDLTTRQSIKDEHMCSGRVNSSCSTSGTHRVALITNPTERTGEYVQQIEHIRGHL